MKKLLMLSFVALFAFACGGGGDDKPDDSATNKKPPKGLDVAPPADDGKGVGEIKSVTLNDPLDADMIAKGKEVYDMKCAACHKMSAKRVVGPGFKGVTDRRKPEWIMNMITNVEMMLDKDAEAQKLLEECLTRMPNQNVSTDDARAILEFFYDNDAT